MKIKQLRSQLTFHRGQRVGILLLAGIILALLYVQFFVSFSEEDSFDYASPFVMKIQCELDSLRAAASKPISSEIYPFNPNFMTDYKAYTLGISAEAFDRLKAHRSGGKWINSVQDFKKVTGVPDSVLKAIGPYFSFPEWVSRSSSKKASFRNHKETFSETEKKDLNTATSEELQSVNGIGVALSKRIIEQRERLGGFSNDQQLYVVWGLKTEVIERLLLQFGVKNPTVISKMNINTSSASDLATIPGISFELGKEIWEFVRVREGITDLSELQKIEGISPYAFKVIALYLYAD